MLSVRELSITFESYVAGLKRRVVPAIRCLDVEVRAGEVVAVVGQSGAGKSLLAHALLGVLPANASVAGCLRFKDEPLTPARMERVRGREIALVPQSVAFLNPLLRVGVQIARAARLSGLARAEAEAAAKASLERYLLAPEVAKSYPFQLSGGMARRVLTATATVGLADLLLADEPTNGLDPDAASESLRHLRELADAGKAVLLITHDLGAALTVADRVAVFCAGTTVEVARAGDFNGSGRLRHPYTTALWNVLPQNGFVLPPKAAYLPVGDGCPFLPDCHLRAPGCDDELPPLRALADGLVRCRHA